MTHDGSGDGQAAAARRLLSALRRRAALTEAVGIVAARDHCGTGEARAELALQQTSAGVDAEAARVAAVVDADADGRADPDWH